MLTGIHTASLSIGSDDSDENPNTFDIEGKYCNGGGYREGGACWYLAPLNTDCNTFCGAYAGVNAAGLNHWDSLNFVDCNTFMQNLGVSPGMGSLHASIQLGCAYHVGTAESWFALTTPQDPAYDGGGLWRMSCPCNN